MSPPVGRDHAEEELRLALDELRQPARGIHPGEEHVTSMSGELGPPPAQDDHRRVLAHLRAR